MSVFTEPLAQAREAKDSLSRIVGEHKGPTTGGWYAIATLVAALDLIERKAGEMEKALRAYHDLMPSLADCANECGEALLYSQAHQANEFARAALSAREEAA